MPADSSMPRTTSSSSARMNWSSVTNGSSSPSTLVAPQLARFSNHILRVRQEDCLKWRRKGNRRVFRRDARDRRVEEVEAIFVDACGDLSGDAACLRVFMKKDDAIRLLHAFG